MTNGAASSSTTYRNTSGSLTGSANTWADSGSVSRSAVPRCVGITCLKFQAGMAPAIE